MANEFKVKLGDTTLPNKEMVEYWRDGKFIAGIYPHQDGIRVVSKYMVGCKPEGGLPAAVVIELADK